MRKTLVLWLAFASSVLASSTPKAELPEIEKLFVPVGFDDNDIVEVVLAGSFNDSCHQLANPIVKVDDASKTILVTPIAFKEPGVLCIQMVSPFSLPVKVGHLGKGEYRVRVASSLMVEEGLKIKEASETAVDDFLYPPVDFAEVTMISGKPVLSMKGRYPEMKKGCMKITDALMTAQEGGEVLVVQPKAMVVEDSGEGCESRYDVKYKVPYELKGRILVHVRTSNGQSYNRVESL